MPNEDGTLTPEEQQAADLEAANAAAQAAMAAEPDHPEVPLVPGDRRSVNLLAEMRRRDDRNQQQIGELRTLLMQMRAPRIPNPQAPSPPAELCGLSHRSKHLPPLPPGECRRKRWGYRIAGTG